MVERPLDLLNNCKGKRVLIYCKDGKVFSGTLLAFDIHINIVIEAMRELDHNGEVLNILGTSFICGRDINIISPGKE